MIEILQNRLANLWLSAPLAKMVSYCIIAVAVVLVSFVANFVAKRWIVGTITRIVKKSKATWDDILVERKVFWRLSHIAPALVIYASARLFPGITDWLQRMAMAYMLVVALFVISAFMSAMLDIYRTFDISKSRPIKGYVQVVKIILFIGGGIFIIASVMGRSPWALLGSLGALTAVLILVFKDSILGLISGIQLSLNNMVQVGDWIEMPKYGADGDVVEISLHTVTVQNWDKTYVSIPAYALISDSFKNWRGMSESGGRRIKRAIYIDMNSIKFVTPEMLQRFEKFHYISDYINTKKNEIDEFNRSLNVEISEKINVRQLTNVGTFRAYIVHYLRSHPKIHNNMTFLVRQLQPSPNGLPIEIYVFTSDTRWVEYEGIQSDIFDHLLAVVPEFELRVFQFPSGLDFRGEGEK